MTTQIVIPAVGESVTSGVIAAWSKKDGEWIDRDETVLELETDKVTMELPSPIAGILKIEVAEGEEVDVGAVVGSIDESAQRPAGGAVPAAAAADAQEPPSAPAAVATQEAPSTDSNGQSHATPLARKVASDLGVDLSKVAGTGAGNRIREQDVVAFSQAGSQPAKAPAAAPSPSAPVPQPMAIPGERSVTRQRMTPLRQRLASRLVEAQQTAAMLTTFNECDMTAVMDMRKKYKEAFEKEHGVGLGFMSFFVKAVANALQAYPLVNAFIVEDQGKPAIEHHDYCDIAIAVASPKGLVVPVLRNTETMSFAQIETSIKDVAVRAHDGKLSLDEMTGGTFTITNGGIFGSLQSTPILNPPQSAILGMHAIKKRPVEDPDNPGQIALRPMMYLAVSYDHRIIDGAEAVRFLVKIKEGLENPERLMLEI